MSKLAGAPALILLNIAIIVVLVWLGVQLADDSILSEVRLPILAIIGVISLLVALMLTALAFAMMDLSDKTQALGLPEGSVRAVIALALIVIFAIIAVFLYSNLADGGEIQTITNLGPGRVKALQDEAARQDSRIVIYAITPAGRDLSNVTYQVRASQDASDFAKQLLTLIGTLVVSVASFYFGSRAVADARAAMAGGGTAPPTITGVRPSPIPSGATAVPVTVLGTGLDRIKEVKLVQGAREIPGKIVDANAGALVFELAGAQAGDWEVVVGVWGGETARSSVKVQ